jgi:hypothetical protein
MQAYDLIVFIQQGKSEFNLLCLITFINSMEAYSMALHPVDLCMYFIQLCFPTKILYVFLVLFTHTDRSEGENREMSAKL